MGYGMKYGKKKKTKKKNAKKKGSKRKFAPVAKTKRGVLKVSQRIKEPSKS